MKLTTRRAKKRALYYLIMLNRKSNMLIHITRTHTILDNEEREMRARHRIKFNIFYDSQKIRIKVEFIQHV